MAIHAAVSEHPQSADLVGGVRDGDPAALGLLYDAFGAGLFRLAYRLTGTREDAEDVVHDVFVGLPEALTRYEERGRLGAGARRPNGRALRSESAPRVVPRTRRAPRPRRPLECRSAGTPDETDRPRRRRTAAPEQRGRRRGRRRPSRPIVGARRPLRGWPCAMMPMS